MKGLLNLVLLLGCFLVILPHQALGQLFVITPGLQLDGTFPIWTKDMATAINAILENSSSSDQIEASMVDLSGDIDPNASDYFIRYNWSSRSDIPGDANNSDIINPLVKAVTNRVNNLRRKLGKRVDVHFIGHSRGCYVNCAVLRELTALPNLGFVHMTTLDYQNLGTDGNLEANPGGIVDWADNYYEKNYKIAGGHTLDGAININLSDALKSWKGVPKQRGSDHNAVFCWYHWTWDQRHTTPYQDQDIEAQRLRFLREKKNTTLSRLFGQGPMVENFNGNDALFMGFFQGISSAEVQRPVMVSREKVKTNQLISRALQMTPAKNWTGASAFFQSFVNGDFSAEFTIRTVCQPGAFLADGIAFVVLDPQGSPPELGLLGANIGYTGMNGFAIVFDAYGNKEHGEPANTDRRVWLRANGQLASQDIFGIELPEAVISGNPFRIRATLNSAKRQLDLKIYSYGADQTIIATGHLPDNVHIPDTKIVGFTAATGTGAQVQIIDDLIIAPQ